MSKFVNSIVLGIVVFVLLLSLFWYVAEVRAEKHITVEGLAARWGTVDRDVTEVRTAISILNPHKAPVQLIQVQYDIIIDGERLENGTRYPTLRIPGESNGTVQFTARIPTTFVTRWWDSYVDNGESSEMVVRGDALFLVGMVETRVPFATEGAWTSSLRTAVADGLDNCAAQPTTVCIASARPEWVTTTDGRRGLAVNLQVSNPGASPVRLHHLSGGLALANVSIAAGSVAEPLLVEANSSVDVDLLLLVDLDSLRTWWPRHVASCEQSPTSALVEFQLEEASTAEGSNDTGTQGPGPTEGIHWELPGQTFQTRFLCDAA